MNAQRKKRARVFSHISKWCRQTEKCRSSGTNKIPFLTKYILLWSLSLSLSLNFLHFSEEGKNLLCARITHFRNNDKEITRRKMKSKMDPSVDVNRRTITDIVWLHRMNSSIFFLPSRNPSEQFEQKEKEKKLTKRKKKSFHYKIMNE